MTLHQAFQLVYEMAQQEHIANVPDDMPEEHARQSEALAIFHDFVVNNSETLEEVR